LADETFGFYDPADLVDPDARWNDPAEFTDELVDPCERLGAFALPVVQPPVLDLIARRDVIAMLTRAVHAGRCA
jgi:hypothetical protein